MKKRKRIQEAPTLTRQWLITEFEAQANQLGLNCEVFSDGPIHAEVAFVGEGPGEMELRHPQRLPFVGGAGTLLWSGFERYKLHRGNVYCTNVVKRQISLRGKSPGGFRDRRLRCRQTGNSGRP